MNKAAVKTIEILEYLSGLQEGGAGISEISRALELPKSSVSDILYTLLQLEYVRYDNEPLKTFRLGVKAAQLGFSAIGQMGVLQIARPFLSHLHAKTGKTVLLAVENGADALFIDKLERPGALQLSIQVGAVCPMHLTAVGKAMLAAHTDEEAHDIVGDGCYATRTLRSIRNWYMLEGALEEIRVRGYADEYLEENNYTCSIAAAIYDHKKQVCGAVAVSFLEVDAEEADIPGLAGAVMQCAQQISSVMCGVSIT